MAIPANPTISELCTEGLKKGGRVNPTVSDISDTQNIHFQEVKSDILLKSPNHKSLEAVVCIPVYEGISRYSIPVYVEDLNSIQLVDSPEGGAWRGTAQAGGTNTITLDPLFSADPADVVGRFVFIVAGTGSGQFAQITGYTDSTKQAVIEAAWATLDTTWVTPNSTSQYMVESIRYKLWQSDKATEFDIQSTPFVQQQPFRCTVVDRQIWMNTVPNRGYCMLLTFWYAIDQLDETSTLFLSHLRKFRSLWITGISTKVANRYDDKRFPGLLQLYNTMLELYGARAANIGQVQYRDV